MPTGLDRLINKTHLHGFSSMQLSSVAHFHVSRLPHCSEAKRLVAVYPCVHFLFGVTHSLRE